MKQETNLSTNRSRQASWLSGMFDMIYRHPILTAAWLCLCCLLINSGEISVTSLLVSSLAVAGLGIVASVYHIRTHDTPQEKRFGVIIAVAAVGFAVWFGYMVYMKQSYFLTVMDGGLAVVGAIFLVLAARGRLTTRNVILLVFAAGFIMRLSYILYMNVSTIQHDMGSFTAAGKNGALPGGHAGYINYLYQNGHLPDFDVRTVDQFYHPPLHHALAALWLKIQVLLGVHPSHIYENIQLLTLFYSSVCLILSYKIFRRLGLKDSGLIVATAVIAFCPTFYIMAGSVNNDVLSIAFILGALYNTICWYKSRKMGRILCIALCVGLGMMTKLSVWMVAPPIAMIFLYVFFNDLRNVKKYLGQFAAFLGVCVPLGLFWAVRNLVRFGVPLTYIPRLSEHSQQFVGNVPALTRLFGFSPDQFSNVAEQFTMYGGSYNEYNPLVGFFKTSVFDEAIAVKYYPMIAGFNHVLFWSAVVLGLAGFAALIYLLVKKNKKIDYPIKVFIGMFYFLMLGMYYYFCFSYPHVCTMNVRYGVPLIVVGALSLGYLAYDLLHSRKKGAMIGGWCLVGVLGVYILSGYLVYHTVALSYVKL